MWPYLQARMTRTMAQVTKEKVPETWEIVEPLNRCFCHGSGALDDAAWFAAHGDALHDRPWRLQ